MVPVAVVAAVAVAIGVTAVVAWVFTYRPRLDRAPVVETALAPHDPRWELVGMRQPRMTGYQMNNVSGLEFAYGAVPQPAMSAAARETVWQPAPRQAPPRIVTVAGRPAPAMPMGLLTLVQDSLDNAYLGE